jgi:glycosyltransferase involved in cell wall biosynthesis
LSNLKLKIVFLDYILELDKPGRTGLSDVVWDMADELIALGHDVHVVAPYPQELAPNPQIQVHTIKVPPSGYRWFIGHLWICERMARVAHRLEPDIVHAPEYVSIAVYNTLYPLDTHQSVLKIPRRVVGRFRYRSVLRPRVNKLPLRVLTVPGNIFHRLRSKQGNPYPFFYTQCLKWAARKSAISGTHVLAISKELEREWRKTGSAATTTHWMPLGFNPHRFSEESGAKERLGISEDTILLLYVGRFSREKAVVELVESVARCQREMRDGNVNVQLFGKGPQTELVATRIRELGVADIVIQSPWLDQSVLPLWYSAADGLLLPSYRGEGFGRVISEAMICGTPVIGSRIAGADDHVLPGRSGFLFEEGDFKALTEILKLVAANPNTLRSLRPFTKEYARENLTWGPIVKKIVESVYLPNI